MLKDLNFDIASLFGCATEHRGRTNDKRFRRVLAIIRSNIIIKRFENTSVFVGRADETVALLLEDAGRTLDGGVNEGHNLKTGYEFTGSDQ